MPPGYSNLAACSWTTLVELYDLLCPLPMLVIQLLW